MSTTYFFVALFYPVPEQLIPVVQCVLGVVVRASPDVLRHLPAVVLRHCVYQALNEHAFGPTRRDVLRSRYISLSVSRMVFLAIANTYLSWLRLSVLHMMSV